MLGKFAYAEGSAPPFELDCATFDEGIDGVDPPPPHAAKVNVATTINARDGTRMVHPPQANVRGRIAADPMLSCYASGLLAVMRSSVELAHLVRAAQFVDVELLHREHRLHGTLRTFGVVAPNVVA